MSPIRYLPVAAVLLCGASALAAPPVLSAFQFTNGVGVNTHIAYTDGLYSNLPLLISDMQYLGVTQIRDGVSNGANGSAPLSSYITVAQAGMNFTLCIYADGDTNNQDILNELAEMDQIEQAVPGSITAIGGANEINNEPVTFNGLTGIAAAEAQQSDLVADVAADPNLAGVPVVYFTGYDAGNVPVGPDPITSGLANYDDQHPYPGYLNGSNAPAPYVSRNCGNTSGLPIPYPNLTAADCATAPGYFTETGYTTNPSEPNNQGVTAAQKAYYSADLLFDAMNPTEGNVTHVDLYDLMDAYAPGSYQGDDLFGLFSYANGSQAPTPAAVYIANIMADLADTGANAASFVPTAESFTVTGLPATGNSLLIEKSNRTYWLAIWSEPAVLSATATVTVKFPTKVPNLTVIDPTTQTSTTTHNANSVTLTVPAHPMLIEASQ